MRVIRHPSPSPLPLPELMGSSVSPPWLVSISLELVGEGGLGLPAYGRPSTSAGEVCAYVANDRGGIGCLLSESGIRPGSSEPLAWPG